MLGREKLLSHLKMPLCIYTTIDFQVHIKTQDHVKNQKRGLSSLPIVLYLIAEIKVNNYGPSFY